MDVREKEQPAQELRRQDVYLSEAQRLSHTASFGWRVSTGEILWSEETFRIFQYDRTTKPTVELILQRVHPEDAALVKQTIERASEDGRDFDHEYRLVMPDGSTKYVRVVAHAFRDGPGGTEFAGAVMDVTAEKEAEKALEENEEKLRLFVEHAPAALAMFDREMRYLHVSRRWLAEFRFGDLDPRGHSHYEVFPGGVRDEWRAAHRRGLAGEVVRKEADRLDWADGSVRWIQWELRPWFAATGEVGGIMIFAEDITERKLAQYKLQQSEAYLSEAQRLSHTGSWAYDLSSGTLFASPELMRILGRDPHEEKLTGQTYRESVHPEDRPFFAQMVDRARNGKVEFECDYRIVLPDGSIKHVQSIAHPVFDESGNLLEYIGTTMDVTERKRAEAELRESEEQWRNVFENNPTMYFMVDASGNVMAVNPFGAEQLGYDVDELVGQPVLRVFHESDREAVRRNVANCLEQLGGARCWEARKVRKDGKVLWVRETAKAVSRVNGPIVLVACEDITEQKRAEEALRQAQANLAHVSRVTTMGELTASLAHEVNQPIAAAVTNANACLHWLAGDGPNLEEARAAAMRMVRDGTRAAEIISRIRLLFKKSAAQQELVDLNEVIREMLVLLHSEATRYFISVRTELAADLPQVMGDRVQLQQVMMNLIMNSIDAMKDVDGTRELAIKSQETENGQVMVSVNDTGVGLPAQQQDQIFNAFFTTKLHGTGMGLSISRSIVESHGGRLWAAENRPRGASFHLTVPRSVQAQ